MYHHNTLAFFRHHLSNQIIPYLLTNCNRYGIIFI
nr:MAG TPA: hypothetical protein [Caudoviricetes sp.]